MDETKQDCKMEMSSVEARMAELFAAGKKPIAVRDAVLEWAKTNDVQLPKDWDYPIRERLCDKTGALKREEINFLLQLPQKVQFLELDSKKYWKTIDGADRADWTIRLRVIHRLARLNTPKANACLIKLAKFDKSKHCRDVAVQYVNMRRLAGKKGLAYPPAYRHLKQLPEMKRINRKLTEVVNLCTRKNHQAPPSIKQVINQFKRQEKGLFWLIEGSTYNPYHEETTELWFCEKCKHLGLQIAELEVTDEGLEQ